MSILYRKMSTTQARAYLLILILLLACITTFVFLFRSDALAMKVVFLNVGQGDAIYIEAPNGNQVLVDGGATNAVLRELAAVMPWFDRTLDVVVATHPDADHIGGLVDVFRRYRVLQYADGGVVGDTAPARALAAAASGEQGVQRTVLRRGAVIDLGGGVTAKVLFPDRDMGTAETNTGSVILLVTYGASSVLLTGDAPSAIEEYLVGLNADELDVDVLKLGHHGSHTSSAESFLAATSPEVAIISAGKDNRYGHPHKEVIDRLQTLHIPYRSTAEEGRIEFVLSY